MQKVLTVAVAAIWAGMILPSAQAQNPLLPNHQVAFADGKISPVQAIEKHAEPIQKFSPAQSPAQISAVQKSSAVQKAIIFRERERKGFFSRLAERRSARLTARATARSAVAIGCASGFCS